MTDPILSPDLEAVLGHLRECFGDAFKIEDLPDALMTLVDEKFSARRKAIRLADEVERLRKVKTAAQAVDEWIGARAISRMTADPKLAAQFGVLVFTLRSLLRNPLPTKEQP